MARILYCQFHPQAWVNDYAVDVDPEGETLFTAPWPDDKPIPKDDSHESDKLASTNYAPRWARSWSGPFYVEITNRDELEPE